MCGACTLVVIIGVAGAAQVPDGLAVLVQLILLFPLGLHPTVSGSVLLNGTASLSAATVARALSATGMT